MNQMSRIIYSSGPTYLINEPNFQLIFDSFGSWTKFKIIESNFKLYSNWIRSFSVLIT